MFSAREGRNFMFVVNIFANVTKIFEREKRIELKENVCSSCFNNIALAKL